METTEETELEETVEEIENIPVDTKVEEIEEVVEVVDDAKKNLNEKEISQLNKLIPSLFGRNDFEGVIKVRNFSRLFFSLL